jgi:16S rRNA (guanine527-N7)-methyltransferase
VDKSPVELLREGLDRMALVVPPGAAERLWDFAAELLKWNARVNLTAITRPEEVVEKHLIDSVAVLPEVGAAGLLLDLGAGAGLPGIPLALVSPALQVTLVDSVGKKVAFMKNAIARLGLAGRVKAEHLHLAGEPEKERMPLANTLISRAFRDVSPWVALASAYRAPGGRIVAMVGKMPGDAELEAVASAHHLRVHSRRTWTLPFSGDPRGAVVFGE